MIDVLICIAKALSVPLCVFGGIYLTKYLIKVFKEMPTKKLLLTVTIIIASLGIMGTCIGYREEIADTLETAREMISPPEVHMGIILLIFFLWWVFKGKKHKEKELKNEEHGREHGHGKKPMSDLGLVIMIAIIGLLALWVAIWMDEKHIQPWLRSFKLF